MHIFEHHVTRLELLPIDHQEDGSYVRSICWTDRHGELHSLELFAEESAEQLKLHLPAPEESVLPRDCHGGLVDLRAEAAPQAKMEPGDVIRCVHMEGILSVGTDYLLMTDCGEYVGVGDCETLEPLPGSYRASSFKPTGQELHVRTTPQARFQVGDKVTPIRADYYFRAGGVYTVNGMAPVGQVMIDGTLRPASQFRLADPDPLAEVAQHPYAHPAD